MNTLDRLRAALPGHTDVGCPDRANGDLVNGTPTLLRQQLEALLGAEQVLSRPTDLVRYASDASLYRLLPQAVVLARDEADVAAVLRYAREHGSAVTFRAAGTSLNGQAQGAGILVDVRRHFGGAVVEADGAALRARPGMIIGHANTILARSGRMLGPDPDSAAAATIGGVVANNASGRACSVAHDSYHTVRSMRVVLASGTVVDTADPDADAQLVAAEPLLVTELLAIKAAVEADRELVDRIRKKFSIKCTNGFRLDAFLDGETPAQILRGLMVCSQGTLGFVSEVVFDTLPAGRWRSTGLLRCRDLHAAANLVEPLIGAGADAADLVDSASLRAAAALPGAPDWLTEVGEHEAALVVQFRAEDLDTLTGMEHAADTLIAAATPLVSAVFTRDPAVAQLYWQVRSGIFRTVGPNRPTGTVLLTDEVSVPETHIADAMIDLRAVLHRFGFDAGVFGSAGVLHFNLVFDPMSQADVTRYDDCMHQIATLVLDTYGGSLKGEHATGRNMAAFLEREWGPTALDFMRRVKHALDPTGILNPGVVLDDDPGAHLRHLKSMPTLGDGLDACLECGFCEAVCPSRDLSTTPRQRIVLQREMARQPHGSRLTRTLADPYEYEAVQTCAGDSSCAIICPVHIDTGAAMKQLRHAEHTPRGERIAAWVAHRWGLFERIVRMAVGIGRSTSNVLGDRPLELLTSTGRRLLGAELVPQWLPESPNAAPARLPATDRARATAVYFPACINRVFGTPAGAERGSTVAEAIVRLGERAGQPVWIPDDVVGTCCATIWHSKGYDDGNTLMANRLIANLWRWSDEGRLPIVIDASTCAYGAVTVVLPYLTEENRDRHARLTIRDSISWARELLPQLSIDNPLDTVVVHPTCSMRHLGDTADLTALAAAIADTVLEPAVDTCCGFAGDRGYLHRELTESATNEEATEVGAGNAQAYVSANRTCELGMQHATGRPYESVLIQLERLTR